MNTEDIEQYKKYHKGAIKCYRFKQGDLVTISDGISKLKNIDKERFDSLVNNPFVEKWYNTMNSIYCNNKNPFKIFSYYDFDPSIIYRIEKMTNDIKYEDDCCVHLVDINTNEKLIAPIDVLVIHTRC